MTIEATAASAPPVEARKPGFLARAGWVLFDWASQPFYTLVSTFLFAPYFANAFIGDPVRGQALWGYAASVAGILIAVFSPILGAEADHQGGLKGWMAVFSLIFIASQALLWLAAPGAPDAVVFTVLFAVVVATVTAEFAANFNNAVMPTLVSAEGVGRLSGIGWATGYVGGLISLVLMAGLVVSNPDTGKSLLGLHPLTPFDPVTREADRLTGPFSALWYAVFIIPYFLFTPDAPLRPGVTFRTAVAQGLASLRETFLNIRQYKDIALFMLARMIFTDGLNAIFIFGGIYGAAVFGWGGIPARAFRHHPEHCRCVRLRHWRLY